MPDRRIGSLRVAILVSMVVALAALAGGSIEPDGAARRAEPPPRPRPLRIQVLDDETGRGVPLVELKTVNQIRYVTDSNGIAAVDEPGLFGRKVFFSIASHGYEAANDGFGYRGKALEITEGGSAQLAIRRLNVAQRLYRVTGAGIYRDSVLTGDPIPIREPLLNGRVFGQDSVVNAVYQGKIHWFWGDTNRPDYPLGNFHVPGATSELPGEGGLDPSIGVNLSYFLDDRGFARPTAPMPGEGPTWISGLVVLRDREGQERMFAAYVKVRKLLEVYQHGLVEFNPQAQRFEKVIEFPEPATYPGEYPGGHPFLFQDHGVEYVYYANPYPLIRIPADPQKLKKIEAYETYTCLKPGTTRAQQQLDRGSGGVLRYGWKPRTQILHQEPQNLLITARRMKPEEALLNLRDVENGKTVLAHGGSVYWNAYRGRWVMIAVESFGNSSFLGEVWFAEADTPVGPWVYARKIVTHQKYSFYNPKQHPMFDKENGRIIFFEGTYTTTFSGNNDPTPRYDYNQVMYQLDLSDRRLALPVAIYEVGSGRDGPVRLVPRTLVPRREGTPPRRVVFFAPDREGIATLPVYERYDANEGQTLSVGRIDDTAEGKDARPVFYILPADHKDHAATAVLHEYREETSGRRLYSVETSSHGSRTGRGAKVLGRVWRNPARLRSG
jgi:hypothetical protein